MKVFIDFDDVIFNTKAFSADLKKFFIANGISEDLFLKYYYDSNDAGAIKLFNPWAMIDRIECHEKIDMNELRKLFKELIDNLTNFVFDDVEDFLRLIGKSNLYLISFGLPTFQNEKITACKIDRLVNGCVVTRSSKADAIRKVIEQMEISETEQIVFIDDRIEQIKDIKLAFPDACTFFLCRKEGRYCDEKNEFCDYEVHDLKEVKHIILNLKEKII